MLSLRAVDIKNASRRNTDGFQPSTMHIGLESDIRMPFKGKIMTVCLGKAMRIGRFGEHDAITLHDAFLREHPQ